MANYQKMLGMSPYSSLTASAMANPLYANLLASYGLLGMTGMEGSTEMDVPTSTSASSSSKSKKCKEEASSPRSKSPASAMASASALHPALSYMYGYNPLLLNQLYAQSLAAANFSLPTSMASSMSSFAGLMAANGMESEEESKVVESGEASTSRPQDLSVKRSHKKEASASYSKPQDLSVKKPSSSSAQPEDLSTKKKSLSSSSSSPQKTPKVKSKSKLDSIVAAISAKAEAKQQQEGSEEGTPEKS
jgi:hypothetical protein